MSKNQPKAKKAAIASVTVECPCCGEKYEVESNGLYKCPDCENVFSVDAFPPVAIGFIDSDTCGVSVADWIIRDMGLTSKSTKWLVEKLRVYTEVPKWLSWIPGISKDSFHGVTPWRFAKVMKDLGASVETAGARLFAKTSIPKCDADERLVIAFLYKGIPHWVGARNVDGKMVVADNLGKVTWDDLCADRGPQLIYRVTRDSRFCRVRKAKAA